MERIVDGFNNNQDEVYVDLVLQDWGDYYTKLVTSVAANRGPDVAISHASTLPELVNQGLTIPLDQLATEIGLDFTDYNDNVMEAVKINGETYALPIDTHPFIWYINTDLANEAGLLDENGEPILEETPEGLKDFFKRAKKRFQIKIRCQFLRVERIRFAGGVICIFSLVANRCFQVICATRK